jgi:uncharacterized membrane protein
MKLTGALKSSFVAGLILITPLAVTLYVLRLVVNWSLQFVNPVVQSTRLTQYTGNIEAVAQVVAAVSIVVSITLLGTTPSSRPFHAAHVTLQLQPSVMCLL